MIFRRNVFYQNLLKINNHNKNKGRTYNAKINQFAILTPNEFSQYYLTFKPGTNGNIKENPKIKSVTNGNAQSNLLDSLVINYGCKGLGVGDQGFCGSCYAFASSDTIAMIRSGQNGIYIRLSAQFLVNSGGCFGNNFSNPFNYIMSQAGIPFEISCPYMGLAASNSNSQSSCGSVVNVGLYFHTITTGCENILSVLQNRPIAVGIYLYPSMSDYG